MNQVALDDIEKVDFSLPSASVFRGILQFTELQINGM